MFKVIKLKSRSKVKDLKEIFNEIARLRLNDTYEINRGGCGIFAIELYKRLEANGKTLKFMWFNHNEIIDPTLYACAHYVLYDGENYYDGTGIRTYHDLISTYGYCGEIEYKDLKYLVDDKDTWNPTFDRNWVSEILDKIDSIFNKFELAV